MRHLHKIEIISLFIISVGVLLLIYYSLNISLNHGTDVEWSEIEINSPLDFNNKTKSEIYEIRKNFVSKTIFNDINYEPSADVFGQIIDNKPWIGMNLCKNEDGTLDINGASEESRFVNNPLLLVGINYPFHLQSCSDNKEKQQYNLPSSIYYSLKDNTVKVIYDSLPFLDFKAYYIFDGLNARDLGYKYAYVDLKYSNLKLKFKNNTNISNTVYEFQNYIHLGGSCGVDGGCNNGSPNQPELNFNYRVPLFNDSAQIYIKLWKEQPQDVNQKPDITEIIVINSILPTGWKILMSLFDLYL